MTIKFRWLDEPPDLSGDTYDEPPRWPEWLLQRHRGRMLLPSEAAPAVGVPDQPDQPAEPFAVPIESTAYRADTLLIPNVLLRNQPLVSAIQQAAGVVFQLPPPLTKVLPADQADHLDEIPRPVALTPADLTSPALVDAWTALRRIRSAVGRNELRWQDGKGNEVTPSLEQRKWLLEVSLDHLLLGAYGGVPVWEQDDVPGQAPSGGYRPEGRHPIAALVGLPKRDESEVFVMADGTKRRPVVAVLDTGVRDHPWFVVPLEVIKDGGSESFLHLSVPTQEALKAHQPVVAGLPHTNVLFDYHDVPIFAEELSDRVNRAVGHGTFIAGLIHQHAPDADVLSLRVMRSDNVGYESDVLLALWLLVDRVKLAQRDPANAWEMIDVVSISLGYYHETWRAEKLARLSAVIKELTSLGVVVVAAAGNDSSRRPFLPAAIASLTTSLPLVVGVGAANPNATTSWYSNGGASASAEAPGTCVVSIFPPDIDGSRSPSDKAASDGRQSVDEDSFSSGFALWSGTSFAAPVLAAAVARKLVEIGASTELTQQATVDRALAALRRLAGTSLIAEFNDLDARIKLAGKDQSERRSKLKKRLKDEKKSVDQ
ncbi:Subtilase family protein [Lentzea waywayandensis]|uniref:Subtilase family protein n=1 Tax=Lentzea waywayandensis TaxID=84724 RepID=A0A1I6FJT6_9PSEU|nr:S8/S53 family peptidase [Lentzea waywayandensis]SFR30144.1 Subtilase family protein [Lentzea waywayandensis]